MSKFYGDRAAVRQEYVRQRKAEFCAADPSLAIDYPHIIIYMAFEVLSLLATRWLDY
jgi:hypothetical protein